MKSRASPNSPRSSGRERGKDFELYVIARAREREREAAPSGISFTGKFIFSLFAPPEKLVRSLNARAARYHPLAVCAEFVGCELSVRKMRWRGIASARADANQRSWLRDEE